MIEINQPYKTYREQCRVSGVVPLSSSTHGWLVSQGTPNYTRTPYEQGGWDYYYGRQARPAKQNAAGELVYNLSPQEIREYMRGYNDELGQKNWG